MISTEETVPISRVIDRVIPVVDQRGQAALLTRPQMRCESSNQQSQASPFLVFPEVLTVSEIAGLDSSVGQIQRNFPEITAVLRTMADTPSSLIT